MMVDPTSYHPTSEQWYSSDNDDDDSDSDRNNLYKNPTKFFEMMGRPVPPMLTFEQAEKQAKTLAQIIFTDFYTLQAILQRHEAAIRKRWMKKSREQRKKILLEVMPDIPTEHRPDVSAIGHETREQRIRGSKYLLAYECPYINLEDLSKPRNLLLFLNSRGRNTPDVFAGSDHSATHLGIVSEAIVRPFLIQYTIFLSGRSTKDTYGSIVSWEEDDDACQSLMIGDGMNIGDGLNVMKQQKRVLRFLISCCEKIMQSDAASLTDKNTPIQPEPASIPAYLDPDTGGFDSLKAMKEEEPYRVPEQLDFERFKGLLSAKRREVEDHLWALREDPGYFAQTAIDYREHEQVLIPDKYGKLHPIVSSPRFWDIIIRDILINAYESLTTWNIAYETFSELVRLREKYLDAITPGKRLPKEYEAAFFEFKVLLDKMVLLPIGQIKSGFTASPPMRHLWVRSEGPRPDVFRASYKAGAIGTDRLTWTLALFGDETQRFLMGVDVIVEQVERIITTQPDQKERLSPYIADVFSEIAFIAELQRQVMSYQPWAGMFEGADAFDKINVQDTLSQKTKLIIEFVDALKGISMGKLGDPSSKRFVYPSEGKPTKATVDAMRSAEQNLDTFWRFVDTEVEKKLGKSLKSLFPFQSHDRQLQRTPPWVPPMPKPSKPATVATKTKAPVTAETTFDTFKNLSINELADTATNTIVPPKLKIKTRGEPSPLSPSPGITFNTSIQLHTPDIQPTIPVDRRAYKVLSTLFNTPSNDHPGEIPWIDFLHAMVSTGFKPQKLYGSVWQFTPMKLDVERSIQFHEPHPGKKMAYRVCRRFGRRLNRAYGWVGGCLLLSE